MIQEEIWQTDIKEALFADHLFMNKCVNVSASVVGGRAVHIPQAGRPSGVKIDRGLFPAAVTQREDSDIIYKLNEFTSNPIRVSNLETIQVSYDKRASIMRQDLLRLEEAYSLKQLANWAALGSDNNVVLKTTGEARDTFVAGTTGKRKAFTVKDLLRISEAMKKQKLGKMTGKMNAMVTPEMVTDITLDPMFIDNPAWMSSWVSTGTLPKIAGFEFVEYPDSTIYKADLSVFRNYNSDCELTGVQATDCASAFFWHSDCVEGAVGDVLVFERIKDPLYYGDIFDFLVMAGGRKNRADGKGVFALVQEVTA